MLAASTAIGARQASKAAPERERGEREVKKLFLSVRTKYAMEEKGRGRDINRGPECLVSSFRS